MAKVAKSKKPIAQVSLGEKKAQRYLVAIPVLALLIKLIVMFNTQFGGWYGADGENYMAGVDGLLKDGFFSTEGKLSYWPAGYPLLIWPLAEISTTKVYYLISFIQSIFFGYATYFFTRQLNKTRFTYLAIIISILISFNPTLSLSSLSVGYETPIAACLMMAMGMAVTSQKSIDLMFSIKPICIAAAWFSLAIFMQPRFIVIGLLFMALWTLKVYSRKRAALLLLLSMIVMAIAPAVMIYRNIEVINQATISTNLGVTMAIGAGDETEGGYLRTGPEVPCEPKPPAKSVSENQKVVCIIKWYLDNPVKTANLAFNKSQFFWSPWSGPLVNGTMARNPWLKIAPTQEIAKSPEGNKLIFGNIGKIVSCGWIVGQIFLLFFGYLHLRGLGNNERLYANLLFLPIAMSWLISIGTVGDHRFRIPTMALSLTLQAAGLFAIKSKLPKVL